MFDSLRESVGNEAAERIVLAIRDNLEVEARRRWAALVKGETMRPYDFGWALEQLRAGMRVGRVGWNGRGMWLCLRNGYPEGVPISDDTAKATGLPAGSVQAFRPYIMMFDAQGSFVPWLASQTDVLAEDWELVQ